MNLKLSTTFETKYWIGLFNPKFSCEDITVSCRAFGEHAELPAILG